MRSYGHAYNCEINRIETYMNEGRGADPLADFASRLRVQEAERQGHLSNSRAPGAAAKHREELAAGVLSGLLLPDEVLYSLAEKATVHPARQGKPSSARDLAAIVGYLACRGGFSFISELFSNPEAAKLLMSEPYTTDDSLLAQGIGMTFLLEPFRKEQAWISAVSSVARFSKDSQEALEALNVMLDAILSAAPLLTNRILTTLAGVGSHEAVRCMLERGADPTRDNFAALKAALDSRRFFVLGQLVKHMNQGSTKLWAGTLQSQEEVLEWLRKFSAGRRIDPNKKFGALLNALGAKLKEQGSSATNDQLSRFSLGLAGL